MNEVECAGVKRAAHKYRPDVIAHCANRRVRYAGPGDVQHRRALVDAGGAYGQWAPAVPACARCRFPDPAGTGRAPSPTISRMALLDLLAQGRAARAGGASPAAMGGEIFGWRGLARALPHLPPDAAGRRRSAGRTGSMRWTMLRAIAASGPLWAMLKKAHGAFAMAFHHPGFDQAGADDATRAAATARGS